MPLRIRWILHCTLGEAAGIAVVAVAYASADRGLVPLAPAVLSAGAWEGLCLGIAQALVLRRAGVRAGSWVLATMLAATLGYGLSLLGGGGSGAPDQTEPALVLVLAAAAAVGAVMGVLMGAVQWLAARAHLGLFAWLWRNAAGWALAMPCIFAGSALVGPGLSMASLAATGAAAGAAAGFALGLVTAPALPSGHPGA